MSTAEEEKAGGDDDILLAFTAERLDDDKVNYIDYAEKIYKLKTKDFTVCTS